ncbi:MAG: hypothetical protein JSS83_12650 [Cyanobacteria bacterium SZAS LIN-3]|nr:hypothetical protein [Cyanobacteria bacterium SZAS LIN-3]MBS2009130.1 hypothetical protein [Cyanobacteria bacterium SZAS TMP-1]
MTSDSFGNGNLKVTYIPLVQQALEALQSLNPVERAILGLRFGLDDGMERDLDEVAEHYGVPVDIIRGVEIDALRKLRHHECYQSPPGKRRAKSTHERKKGQKPHLYVVE